MKRREIVEKQPSEELFHNDETGWKVLEAIDGKVGYRGLPTADRSCQQAVNAASIKRLIGGLPRCSTDAVLQVQVGKDYPETAQTRTNMGVTSH